MFLLQDPHNYVEQPLLRCASADAWTDEMQLRLLALALSAMTPARLLITIYAATNDVIMARTTAAQSFILLELLSYLWS